MANDVIEVMYSTWPDVYMCAHTLQIHAGVKMLTPVVDMKTLITSLRSIDVSHILYMVYYHELDIWNDNYFNSINYEY